MSQWRGVKTAVNYCWLHVGDRQDPVIGQGVWDSSHSTACDWLARGVWDTAQSVIGWFGRCGTIIPAQRDSFTFTVYRSCEFFFFYS